MKARHGDERQHGQGDGDKFEIAEDTHGVIGRRRNRQAGV
jgi:hypothetical protein